MSKVVGARSLSAEVLALPPPIDIGGGVFSSVVSKANDRGSLRSRPVSRPRPSTDRASCARSEEKVTSIRRPFSTENVATAHRSSSVSPRSTNSRAARRAAMTALGRAKEKSKRIRNRLRAAGGIGACASGGTFSARSIASKPTISCLRPSSESVKSEALRSRIGRPSLPVTRTATSISVTSAVSRTDPGCSAVSPAPHAIEAAARPAESLMRLRLRHRLQEVLDVLGVGPVGRELQSLLEIGLGFARLLLLVAGESAVIVGGRIRLDRDGLVEGRLGLRPLFFVVEKDAPVQGE